MDYCSTCRRHLNGALVCPGCGAYAPDIAPNTTADSAVRFAPGSAADPTTGDAHDPAAGDSGPFGWDPAFVPGEPPAEVTQVPPARQHPGRAARRRQQARWKKTQRRALVATAVALVGGGLTVASLDRHTADRAQAAPAPGAPHTDAVDRQPAQQTRPATAHTGPRHAAASPTGEATDGVTHRGSTAITSQSGSTAAQGFHTDSAAPRTAVTTPAPAAPRHAGGSGGSVTSSGGSDTDRPPTSTTQNGSQSTTSTGTGSGTPQHDTTTTAPSQSSQTQTQSQSQSQSQTSPSSTSTQHQLCLLVLCLG